MFLYLTTWGPMQGPDHCSECGVALIRAAQYHTLPVYHPPSKMMVIETAFCGKACSTDWNIKNSGGYFE